MKPMKLPLAVTAFLGALLALILPGFLSQPVVSSSPRLQTITCHTYPAGNMPRAIPDMSTITSTINVANNEYLWDAAVVVTLTHTYMSDLEGQICTPWGKCRSKLWEAYWFYGDQTYSASFSDLGEGSDWYPAEPIGGYGHRGSGRWTLNIEDIYGGDSGSLDGWAMRLCTVSGGGQPPTLEPPTPTYTPTPIQTPDLRPDHCAVIIPNPGHDTYCGNVSSWDTWSGRYGATPTGAAFGSYSRTDTAAPAATNPWSVSMPGVDALICGIKPAGQYSNYEDENSVDFTVDWSFEGYQEPSSGSPYWSNWSQNSSTNNTSYHLNSGAWLNTWDNGNHIGYAASGYHTGTTNYIFNQNDQCNPLMGFCLAGGTQHYCLKQGDLMPTPATCNGGPCSPNVDVMQHSFVSQSWSADSQMSELHVSGIQQSYSTRDISCDDYTAHRSVSITINGCSPAPTYPPPTATPTPPGTPCPPQPPVARPWWWIW